MTDRLIPLAVVLERTGRLSATTIWRLRRRKQFPEPVAVSANRKVWREADVNSWIERRTAAPPEASSTANEAEPAT